MRLVTIQVLEFLSEDIDGTVFPVPVQKLAHSFDLLCLVGDERVKIDWLITGLEKFDKQHIVVVVVTPDAEELQCRLRADACPTADW